MTTPLAELPSLPRFTTLDGQLVDAVDQDVSHGLALEEVGQKVRGNELHDVHMETARLILNTAGCLIKPVIMPEGYVNYFYSSEWHVDGLTHAYFQGHTTQEDTEIALAHQGASELDLMMFTLTTDEHAGLQRIHDQLRGPGPMKTILMGGPLHPDASITLRSVLRDRAPERKWRTVAHPSKTTLVFPNGYAADPQSSAANLYIHSGRTILRPFDTTEQRTISLSRIESS